MAHNFRLISALLTLAACAQVANADVSNQIYAGNQSAAPSQTVTIPINMKNSVEATAYSFSISLPAGVEPTNVTLAKSTARKTDNVVFDYAVQSDNSIMALCYSADGEEFTGNDGEVATVSFEVPATMAAGNYDIVIKESEISESGIAHRVTDEVTSLLTVSSTLPERNLKDGTTYSETEDMQVSKVTYTRTFNASNVGKWQALYIPFSFEVAEYRTVFDIAEIFTMCPTKDTNGDYKVDGNDNPSMIVTPITSGKTLANTAYMLRPKTSGDVVIVSENCVLRAAKNNPVEFSSSRTKYTVNGIYKTKELTPGDNNYAMGGGNLSYAVSNALPLGPYRWYMHAEPKNYSAEEESAIESEPMHIRIVVLGEDIDEETALQFIQADAIQNCSGTDIIYNINGVRVEDTNALPTGIYVKNGKTFMIR